MALDAQVRHLVEGGDLNAAAAAVIEVLGPAILRYLRSMLREEDDAADAFSQWAENVWLGLATFRFGSSLKTWSYRLAWNAGQNLRNEAWRRHGQRLASGQASQLAESIRTRSAVVVERQRQALDELRAALDDAERSLLTLRIDQQLSWDEVSEVMTQGGQPVEPSTLMKRFERIKAKLGRLARQRGLLEELPSDDGVAPPPRDPGTPGDQP
jgi:RNA polymerase sigma-70 factor (ECF subfamily)